MLRSTKKIFPVEDIYFKKQKAEFRKCILIVFSKL